MITSRRSPISVTRVVRSSSAQGLSSELTRVQSWVEPKSVLRAISTRPCRAASLWSALIASSRLPSRTSTVPTSCGTLAAIFSLDGSKKWIARLGRAGISRSGSGAPTASGRKKSLGERMRGRYRRTGGAGMTYSTPAGSADGGPVGDAHRSLDPPPAGLVVVHATGQAAPEAGAVVGGRDVPAVVEVEPAPQRRVRYVEMARLQEG